MNRIQFWVLTASILVVGPLFLTDIFINSLVIENSRKAVAVEQLAQEGPTYNNRWQQLAARVYQVGQQDPALREVLVHQQINVTPKNSAPAPAPAPAATPAFPNPTSSRNNPQ
jgi:hypothetical protein